MRKKSNIININFDLLIKFHQFFLYFIYLVKEDKNLNLKRHHRNPLLLLMMNMIFRSLTFKFHFYKNYKSSKLKMLKFKILFILIKYWICSYVSTL
jgi:hypothetical protein